MPQSEHIPVFKAWVPLWLERPQTWMACRTLQCKQKPRTSWGRRFRKSSGELHQVCIDRDHIMCSSQLRQGLPDFTYRAAQDLAIEGPHPFSSSSSSPELQADTGKSVADQAFAV